MLSEFTCWVLTELITLQGPQNIVKANVNLQVTLMYILATRNAAVFSSVIADYIQIGLGM